MKWSFVIAALVFISVGAISQSNSPQNPVEIKGGVTTQNLKMNSSGFGT